MRRTKYDAFVAYSEEDLQWVTQQLIPQVEQGGEPNEKLCLCVHHRDFLPGIPIEENILQSIKESNKTILILSENFVKRPWCEFETRVARA